MFTKLCYFKNTIALLTHPSFPVIMTLRVIFSMINTTWWVFLPLPGISSRLLIFFSFKLSCHQPPLSSLRAQISSSSLEWRKSSQRCPGLGYQGMAGLRVPHSPWHLPELLQLLVGSQSGLGWRDLRSHLVPPPLTWHGTFLGMGQPQLPWASPSDLQREEFIPSVPISSQFLLNSFPVSLPGPS